MKQLIIVPILIASAITSGCVIKTSSSGDPASPSSNTPSSTAPATPSPSPAKPVAAKQSPAPSPAPAKQAGDPNSFAKKDTATPAHPAAPAPAPTAHAETPAPKQPPQPVFTPPPKPKAQPAERKAKDADGVPPHMKPGAPLAYWIWRDADGETWHLRTTTSTLLHRFSGRIWVDGTIQELKPTRLETEDRLKKEDEGVIVFDFTTQGVMDGFDFKVAAGRCVTFHLLVDGKPAPKEVEIGQKELPAGSATFRLCK